MAEQSVVHMTLNAWSVGALPTHGVITRPAHGGHRKHVIELGNVTWELGEGQECSRGARHHGSVAGGGSDETALVGT